VKYLFALIALLTFSFLPPALSAQTVDASVCDILANPMSFDGKTVRIKGSVVAGLEVFTIKDPSCGTPVQTNAIWLAYPEGSKAKAGPAVFVQLQLSKNNPAQPLEVKRSRLKLERNKEFKQFDSLLSTPFQTGGMCLGCVRYMVNATLVGRLDGAKVPGVLRNDSGQNTDANGFGNLNFYTARLVLESVSNVSPIEIDYSKAGAVTKDDSQGVASGGGDPIAAAHQLARTLASGDPLDSEKLERAAAAFGKEGEDNGVEVGFGVPNEVPKSDTIKAESNSPDGLLFNCTFDMDRLKGAALVRAITHVGAHIADIRNSKSPRPGSSPFGLELGAWEVTVISASGSRPKTLTLPGGFLIWNSDWPHPDRFRMFGDAIDKYLIDWRFLKPPPQM
jgi:hypothetical protein